jgi:replication initiation and membrane attachment protein DnaB
MKNYKEINYNEFDFENFETSINKYTIPFLKSTKNLTNFCNELALINNVCPKELRKYLSHFIMRDLIFSASKTEMQKYTSITNNLKFPKTIREKNYYLRMIDYFNDRINFKNKKICDLHVYELFDLIKEINKMLKE